MQWCNGIISFMRQPVINVTQGGVMKEYVIPTILVAVSIMSLSFVATYLFELLGHGVINIGGLCVDGIHIYPDY